jgi:pyruvate dehydrogenase E2 component (dihydrolipoamide acetyltransferase)
MMATIIGLPKLSPTMEEGVLAKWHKKEGDKISPGDVVAEVETDKANMDFPIEDEGTILKLLVGEGDTVKLGAPVAILGEQGEDISGLVEKAATPTPPTPPTPPAQPAPPAAAPAPRSAPPAPPSLRPPPPRAPSPSQRRAAAEAGATAAPAAAAAPSGPLLASPLAKTLAAENGVDLRLVRGTGPGGRIVERDVRAAMNGSSSAPAASAAAATAAAPEPAAEEPSARAPAQPAPAPGEAFVDKSLSLMRKTIARRLAESKQQVPHFYLTSSCDAAPLVAFRAALNTVLGDAGKITVNDLIVKASALALRKVPSANASFLGDRIRTHGRVHMGIAVSVDDGLITPVVHDADTKSLRVLSAEIRDLAERARARKLTSEELSGGTFTVSNLGMYGVDHFEAIINPPEGAILAVGAAHKVPVVVDDEIVIGHRMSLSLSCDHRVVDGALGARLLQAIVDILEHPAALAL